MSLLRPPSAPNYQFAALAQSFEERHDNFFPPRITKAMKLSNLDCGQPFECIPDLSAVLAMSPVPSAGHPSVSFRIGRKSGHGGRRHQDATQMRSQALSLLQCSRLQGRDCACVRQDRLRAAEVALRIPHGEGSGRRPLPHCKRKIGDRVPLPDPGLVLTTV